MCVQHNRQISRVPHPRGRWGRVRVCGCKLCTACMPFVAHIVWQAEECAVFPPSTHLWLESCACDADVIWQHHAAEVIRVRQQPGKGIRHCSAASRTSRRKPNTSAAARRRCRDEARAADNDKDRREAGEGPSNDAPAGVYGSITSLDVLCCEGQRLARHCCCCLGCWDAAGCEHGAQGAQEGGCTHFGLLLAGF